MTRAVGVDWGSNGWVCACLEDDEWSITLQPSILSVWEHYRDKTDQPILVDIPIGLLGEGTRSCDQEAKSKLGSRGSSVFLTPPRPALTAPTYDEARATTESRTDHSLTTQAWRLLPRIQAVDDFLQTSAAPELDRRIREAHPEVCFHALANSADALESKHDAAGVDARKAILESHVGGAADAYDDLVEIHIDDQPAYARRFRSSNADDILDAMVLAATGSVADGSFERFGGDTRDPVLDREIEIVYATVSSI